MGHDTTHVEKKPVLVTKTAMIFALMIIGLIIATANFVQVMGHSEGGHGEHGGGHATEAAHGEHGAPAHDAPKGHDDAHAQPAAHEAAPAKEQADAAHAEAAPAKDAHQEAAAH